jgi:hypothetical protein
MLVKPLKPITRKIVMCLAGEDAFDDFLRFVVAHRHEVRVSNIKGSSAFREMKARAMYWARKEDEKEFRAAMKSG